MSINKDDLERQLYSIKGSQRVTIIKQDQEGKETIIEDKLHPFRLWAVKGKWCLAISDDPNANPFWVVNGTEPGYGVQGIWPEEEEITEAKVIIEHHCQVYKKEYGTCMIKQFLARCGAEEKKEGERHS